MSTNAKIALIVCLALLPAVAFVPVTTGQDAPASQPVPQEQLVAALRQLVDRNLQAAQAEDLEAYMAQMHPQSPLFESTRRTMRVIFDRYQMDYQLMDVAFIGTDGQYAVVRARSSTRKVSGPEFRDNVTDVMHVFRQDEGQWKFWQTAVLEVRPPQ